MQDEQALKVLRLPEVVKRLGISRTGIYDRIRENNFPRSVQVGKRSIGFIESEINDYIKKMMSNR